MNANNKPPDWIFELLQDTRVLLGIGDEWFITAQMADNPNGYHGDEVDGSASVDPAYLNATIELSRNIRDDPNGHRVVQHEMWHVALAEMAQAVSYIIARLPESDREWADQIYSDSEERFIQRTVRAMQRTIKPQHESKATDPILNAFTRIQK